MVSSLGGIGGPGGGAVTFPVRFWIGVLLIPKSRDGMGGFGSSLEGIGGLAITAVFFVGAGGAALFVFEEYFAFMVGLRSGEAILVAVSFTRAAGFNGSGFIVVKNRLRIS